MKTDTWTREGWFDEFLHALSHDLQAPLRRIKQYASILMEDFAGKLDEEGKRIVSVIVRNASTMENLIATLRDLTRLGEKEMQYAETDMARLAQSVFNDLTVREGGRPITFSLGEMPPSHSDSRLIREAFQRLLDNALKFTARREGAVIEAGGSASGSELIYYVKDNGAGFDMEYAHKLFQPFQRLHRPDEYPGTGAGLAAVRLIIERHKGRVWAEGAPGEGAVFYFALPALNKGEAL